MTSIKVAPDKTYLITEERLRFPVAADCPPAMVPFTVFSDLKKSIDILEKNRGWRLLDAAPPRKRMQFPGGKPCCADIMGKRTGESLTIKFMPSDFQGDTDDAHNFDELSNPAHRLRVENTIDWVAIMHFWEPALVIDKGVDEEFAGLGLAEGFMPWNQMPDNFWPVLRKRFENNGN